MEKYSCATLEKEKKTIVHYELGYVSSPYSSLDAGLAYMALTTLIGVGVVGHITLSLEKDETPNLRGCTS